MKHKNETSSFPRRKFLKLSGLLSATLILSFFYSLKDRAGGFISFAFLKKQVPYIIPTYVEDVFSIDAFTGTGTTQTITNNIDFTGKGGAVWSATRTGADGNGPEFINTLRGGSKRALTTSLTAEYTLSDPITFNNNGFSMTSTLNTYINSSGFSKVAWSFRKQANFFDMVTWTGDGTASRQIPHNLGDVPGLVFVKHLSTATRNWFVLSEPLAELKARAGIGLYLNTTGGFTTAAPGAITNASGTSNYVYFAIA
jgi:hypothetical protein